MPTNQNTFWEHYNKLPPDVQEAMITMESANVIYETAKSEHLLPKVSRLAEITGDVMLGILPIMQFRQAIQDELGIEEEKARRIAKAVRDKIFLKIVDSLRRIHNLK